MLLRLIPLILSVACSQAQHFSWNALGNFSQPGHFDGYDRKCDLASVADRFDCYPEPRLNAAGVRGKRLLLGLTG
ncbi:hypothetical protein MRX96_022817 [Rhipicephalus microplus]